MYPFLLDQLSRIAFQRSLAQRACAHPTVAIAPKPAGSRCLPCDEAGQQWVKLRICMTCAAVGCCDSSSGRHARAHFDATGHPLMRSIEPGETWAWCYPDEAYLNKAERTPAASG